MMERGSNLNIPEFGKEQFYVTLYVTTINNA